jgi:hypothetical protein
VSIKRASLSLILVKHLKPEGPPSKKPGNKVSLSFSCGLCHFGKYSKKIPKKAGI